MFYDNDSNNAYELVVNSDYISLFKNSQIQWMHCARYSSPWNGLHIIANNSYDSSENRCELIANDAGLHYYHNGQLKWDK